MNHLVSVIIPTFGEPIKLDKAIRSVLEQDYQNIEIIVVDDNGKGNPFQEAAEKIIKDFQKTEKNIKYLCHETHINGSAARNSGILVASGKYIALLDDDDYFLPNKIKLQVNEMESSLNDLKLCFTWFYKINVNGIVEEKKFEMPEDLVLAILLNKVMFTSSTLMFTKEVWDKIGGFDESFLRQQDTEFIIRGALVSELFLVREICISRVMLKRNSPLESDYFQKVFEHLINKMGSVIRSYPKKIQAEILYNYRCKIALRYLKEFKLFKALQQIMISGKPVLCFCKLVRRVF